MTKLNPATIALVETAVRSIEKSSSAELVVEIRYSSLAYDLGPKLELYRRFAASDR